MKLAKLNRRERMAVGFGGGTIVLFLLLQFIVFPLLDGRERLSKRVVAREKAVVEMRLLQERFRKMGQQTGSISAVLAQRDPSFSLFSFLEEKAAGCEVKDLIAYMKPSESTEHDQFKQSQVEMKLQAVGLSKLVTFLEQVEAPDQLVAVDKLTIQENAKEAGTLDATLVMVSVDQAGTAASR